MTKRLVDIDDARLDEDREIFGAVTMRQTVNRALEEVVKLELRRRRHVEQLVTTVGLDPDDPEVMKGAWR